MVLNPQPISLQSNTCLYTNKMRIYLVSNPTRIEHSIYNYAHLMSKSPYQHLHRVRDRQHIPCGLTRPFLLDPKCSLPYRPPAHQHFRPAHQYLAQQAVLHLSRHDCSTRRQPNTVTEKLAHAQDLGASQPMFSSKLRSNDMSRISVSQLQRYLDSQSGSSRWITWS